MTASRFRLRRHPGAGTDGGGRSIRGVARVGPRTKDLALRLEPGEIAVINHRDIDRVAAESLIAAGVAAVVNAEHSISGRYPNGGPIRIVRAGIPLLDGVGVDVMAAVRDGEILEVRDGALWRGDEVVVRGVMLGESAIESQMEQARLGIGGELQRFARNTLEWVDREAELTFGPVALPPLHTQMGGRHALVVVRGHDYKSDLGALRPYIREYRPVLIAVDGGADALLEFGLRPDVIIGDFDSVSPGAMHEARDLVHHVHVDGRAPGREALAASGLPYVEFVADGMSEDVAMLLAYEAGATLIVVVGAHTTMVEFLDKGRKGMASTFLTRLRLGPVLVDAKGVNRLYEGRVRRRDMLALVGAALVAMLVMTVASDDLRTFFDGFVLWLHNRWRDLFGRF